MSPPTRAALPLWAAVAIAFLGGWVARDLLDDLRRSSPAAAAPAASPAASVATPAPSTATPPSVAAPSAPLSTLASTAAPPPPAPTAAPTAAPTPVPPAPPAPLAAPAPPPPTRARVAFDRKAEDFGSVPHGTLVRRTFTFRNVGEDPLEVLGVRTSCGCTAAEPSRRRLAPGESGEVAVVFDTSKKPLPHGKQRYSNTISFDTSDAQERDGRPGTTMLRLEGEVVAWYQSIPEAGLVFVTSGGASASAVTATVEVIPGAEALPGGGLPPPLDAAVVSVTAAPAGVALVGRRAVERDGRRGVALEFALGAGARLGVLEGSVALSTGSAAQPAVVLPVRGFVQAPFQAVPGRVSLEGAEPFAARQIRVVGARAAEVVGAEVVCEGGAPAPFTAEVTSGREVLLRAAPRPGTSTAGEAPAPGRAGEVLIFLSAPDYPLLRVPFAARDGAGLREAAAAHLAAGVRVSPEEAVLPDVTPGQPVPETVVIVARASPAAAAIDPLEITVEPAGAVEARLVKPQPGQMAQLWLRIAPGTAPGRVEATVRLRPRPGADLIAVRASGRVLSPLVAEPPALVLAPGGASAETTVRRLDGKPARVLSAKDPAGRLDVAIHPRDDGGATLVVVARAPRAPGSPPARCELVATTDAPDAPEVRIPVLER